MAYLGNVLPNKQWDLAPSCEIFDIQVPWEYNQPFYGTQLKSMEDGGLRLVMWRFFQACSKEHRLNDTSARAGRGAPPRGLQC